jgi:hypothetical protein
MRKFRKAVAKATGFHGVFRPSSSADATNEENGTTQGTTTGGGIIRAMQQGSTRVIFLLLLHSPSYCVLNDDPSGARVTLHHSIRLKRTTIF